MEADDIEAAELLKALFALVERIGAHDAEERRRISAARLDGVMLVDAMLRQDEDAEQACIDACMERVRAYSDAGDVAAHGWELAAIGARLGLHNCGLWIAVRVLLRNVLRDLPDTEATALH